MKPGPRFLTQCPARPLIRLDGGQRRGSRKGLKPDQVYQNLSQNKILD
jgi:hypothetical protein